MVLCWALRHGESGEVVVRADVLMLGSAGTLHMFLASEPASSLSLAATPLC
jgi:hypothetical protein